MKHLVFLLAAMLAFGNVDVAMAQKSTVKPSASNKKGTPPKSKLNVNKKSSVKPSDNSGSTANSSDSKSKNIKSNDDFFGKKKKSWAIGVHGGYAFIPGDIPVQTGIGYGFYVQKALGHTLSLRANFTNGYATGMSWSRTSSDVLAGNPALNGGFDPKVDYSKAAGGFFYNYRSDFTKLSLEAVVSLNNLNFMSENPRLNLYAVFGGGALLFDTRMDALNAKGEMYDFSDIPNATEENKKATYSRLREKLDGTYESRAEGNTNTSGKLLDRSKVGIATLGLGLGYKLTERISLNLEATYGYTGSDLLDGQRWWIRNVPTPNPDAFWYTNLGINFRLGRTENVYWYTNPLSMPFKTIMENKKKLQKVDKLEKDVEDLNAKVDSTVNDMQLLKSDNDSDGVSDYFDLEDNTPSGSIVDGSGRTIFYKDDNGNLVYQDPNMSGGNAGGNNNQGGFTGNNNNNGSRGSNTNHNGKTKSSFNKSDPKGKTIVMKSDGKGGLTTPSPGVMTSAGYMPAIFFESGSYSVNRNAYADLFEVARTLKSNPNIRLHVIGNTDYRSTETFNKKLGLRRAQQVADALVKYFGVSKDQLVVESRGELEPLTNAKTMDALAANRRVQFEVEGAPGTGKSNTPVNEPTNKGGKTKKSKTKLTDPNTPNPNELGNDVDKKLKETEKPAQQQTQPENQQKKSDSDF